MELRQSSSRATDISIIERTSERWEDIGDPAAFPSAEPGNSPPRPRLQVVRMLKTNYRMLITGTPLQVRRSPLLLRRSCHSTYAAAGPCSSQLLSPEACCQEVR